MQFAKNVPLLAKQTIYLQQIDKFIYKKYFSRTRMREKEDKFENNDGEKKMKKKDDWLKGVDANKEQNKSSLLDENINITINARKLLKYSLIVIVLIVVFFAGRISTEFSSSNTIESLTGLATSSADETVTQTDSTTTDVTETDSIEETAASAAENENAAEAAGTELGTDNSEIDNSETEEDTNAEEVEDANAVEETITEPAPAEKIITKYSKVAVSLNDITIEPKETWGKIIQLDFTIKNNEDGTILPDQFLMSVEGYNDYEKSVPLSTSSKVIKSGAALNQKVNIPKGFAYNEVTIGKLTNVKVKITLIDGEGREMGSYEKAFDLE